MYDIIPITCEGFFVERGEDVWVKQNVTKNDGIKKVEFYETEKVREKMEDMRLYIQIVMESRSFCIVGN